MKRRGTLKFIISGYLYSTIMRHYRKLQITFLMNMVEKIFKKILADRIHQSIKGIINDYRVAFFQRCKDG